ncbi:endonuclease domain-containing protein [Streptomyces sp. NPDC017448]|uniref:endonuclease domain-containing protein n=1 Tax=Streptomyces sp. NPDC017448 TaxID=3364996 RepID=UPI0037A08F75
MPTPPAPRPGPPRPAQRPPARLREHGPRAADSLCAACETTRPATDGDHCHHHSLIRGSLSGSCNTMEGQGKEPRARPGSLQHLLPCDGCRARRSCRPTTGLPRYAAICT